MEPRLSTLNQLRSSQSGRFKPGSQCKHWERLLWRVKLCAAGWKMLIHLVNQQEKWWGGSQTCLFFWLMKINNSEVVWELWTEITMEALCDTSYTFKGIFWPPSLCEAVVVQRLNSKVRPVKLKTTFFIIIKEFSEYVEMEMEIPSTLHPPTTFNQ